VNQSVTESVSHSDSDFFLRVFFLSVNEAKNHIFQLKSKKKKLRSKPKNKKSIF